MNVEPEPTRSPGQEDNMGQTHQTHRHRWNRLDYWTTATTTCDWSVIRDSAEAKATQTAQVPKLTGPVIDVWNVTSKSIKQDEARRGKTNPSKAKQSKDGQAHRQQTTLEVLRTTIRSTITSQSITSTNSNYCHRNTSPIQLSEAG